MKASKRTTTRSALGRRMLAVLTVALVMSLTLPVLAWTVSGGPSNCPLGTHLRMKSRSTYDVHHHYKDVGASWWQVGYKVGTTLYANWYSDTGSWLNRYSYERNYDRSASYRAFGNGSADYDETYAYCKTT